jgi:hypothetical protein
MQCNNHTEFLMVNLLVRKGTGRLEKVKVITGNTVAREEHNARRYGCCQGMKKSKEFGAELCARTYYCVLTPLHALQTYLCVLYDPWNKELWRV